MATITSTIKMQDQATSTFNNISKSVDNVIKQSQLLDSVAAKVDSGGSNNPKLQEAVGTYQKLIAQQEQLNYDIELMDRKTRMLNQSLASEKSSYTGNESSILKIEQALNSANKQKQKMIDQSDNLTKKITQQEQNVIDLDKNMGRIPNTQEQIKNGFSEWQAKIVTINQAIQLVKQVAAGIGKVLDYSDNLTLTKARLNLVNDGLQTTDELQNKIYQAAQRSRGSYDDMASSVSKLGLLAGDAFKNNDEMIAFSEMMNKSFKVSGASNQEISSATYQLTQAMAAGKLQGDEFRSIMENAPMLADAIAKYMGKSKGELKELSSEGVITAAVIKNSLFSAADDINAKYEQMPKTFGDTMTSIKNTASRYLQPVADKITELLNSETFQSALNNILRTIASFAGFAIALFYGVGNAIDWCKNNMWLIGPVLVVISAIMMTSMLTAINNVTLALWKQAAAWLAANWQILAIAGVGAIVIGVLIAMKAPMEAIIGVIALIVMALAIWKIVQWAVNGAMYACPIVWIIALVIALVAAIYLFMQWMAKATGLAGSGLGMIAGGVNVVIQFFKNLGLQVANIALGIWNALGACASNIGTAFHNVICNIQSWFYGLLGTAVDTVKGIVDTLNKLPFIDIDTSGIESKASEYAKKKSEAEDNKEEYKDVAAEFDKGMSTFKTFKDGWVQEAFQSGSAWGDNIANKISDAVGSFDPTSLLGDTLSGMDPTDYGQGYDYSSMLDPNGNVPVSVKDGEVNISDEDLKMLKDIATKDYMLNYKHITPNVNIEFGDVKETADVNQVKTALEKMMNEELAELYVVEEA